MLCFSTNTISTVFVYSVSLLSLYGTRVLLRCLGCCSVSSFMYRIVNRILRFVSRYVSNRSIVYRYTPSTDTVCQQRRPAGSRADELAQLFEPLSHKGHSAEAGTSPGRAPGSDHFTARGAPLPPSVTAGCVLEARDTRK